MIKRFLVGTIAVVLAACQPGQAEPHKPGQHGQAQASAREAERKTDLYQFKYAYPAQAGNIAALKDHLEKDLAKSESEVKAQALELWEFQKELAQNDLAEARGDEIAGAREGLANIEKYQFPFRPHYLAVAWGVAADLPRWLSMSARIETYSGGAHGNSHFDSLIWDRQASVVRQTTDLFMSGDALRAAIQPRFCDLIDAEREKRRGVPVKRSEDDTFSACIDPLESTVLLESSGGGTFEAISVLVAPYQAGSYAEGSFVIKLPVSAALIAAAKPEYRKSFQIPQ